MSIADFLRRQPDALVFFEALLIVFAIGLLDSMGGWDVSMFLLYAFPILLVVWFSDRRWAIVCAIACGVVWFLAKKSLASLRHGPGLCLGNFQSHGLFSFCRDRWCGHESAA